MRLFFLGLMSVSFLYSFGQSIPYDELIPQIKKGIIPIMCRKTEDAKTLSHLGTGFSIEFGENQHTCFAFITCEHVVAIKDSISHKTTGIRKSLYAQLNLENDSTVSAEMEVIFSDETKDYAILQLKQPLSERLKNSTIRIQNASIGSIKDGDDLVEGDYLLYSGYPMSFGVGYRSYPVSRTAIVSQNIRDSANFLIDGFAQGGYSGSPVFRIRMDEKEGVWKYFIVGMIQAYPTEKAILKSKKQQPNNQADLDVIVNPGFTIAIKMKDIKNKILQTRCIP